METCKEKIKHHSLHAGGALFVSWVQLVQVCKPLVLWLGSLGCIINGIFGVASAHTCAVGACRHKDQRVLASCYSQHRYLNAEECCYDDFYLALS